MTRIERKSPVSWCVAGSCLISNSVSHSGDPLVVWEHITRNSRVQYHSDILARKQPNISVFSNRGKCPVICSDFRDCHTLGQNHHVWRGNQRPRLVGSLRTLRPCFDFLPANRNGDCPVCVGTRLVDLKPPDSPCPDLLLSNAVPTDFRVLEIKNVIEGVEED